MMDVSGEKPKELAEGGQFNFCIRPFILPLRLETEVEQAVPDKRIVWSAKKLGVFAKHEFFFEDSTDGVKVTSIETFTGFKLVLACFTLGKEKLRSLTSMLLGELKKASESSTRSR